MSTLLARARRPAHLACITMLSVSWQPDGSPVVHDQDLAVGDGVLVVAEGRYAGVPEEGGLAVLLAGYPEQSRRGAQDQS